MPRDPNRLTSTLGRDWRAPAFVRHPAALRLLFGTAAAAVVTGVVILTAGILSREAASGPIAGFTAEATIAQRAAEARFLRVPSEARARLTHRFLTAAPHPPASIRNRELADWIRDRWTEFGLEDVRIWEHQVLVPFPEEVRVTMAGPHPWQASMREQVDETHGVPDPGVPYHAYSASGDVTAPVVYAGVGAPEDYEWLARRGIDVRGKIVLVRHAQPYTYRGSKVFTAERHGAVAVLFYCDPADDGEGRGAVYPDGPWGPETHVQRGAVAYDFLAPGDPLTPGWASTPGARRLSEQESLTLPKIPSVPLSARDARVIVKALGGLAAPSRWQGAFPFPYHTGPGPAIVTTRVRMENRVRPIWTVTGTVRGADFPDALVIAGNHRDAWTFGGVDPSSGTVAMMELARGLGELLENGFRPRRTILLASWDAEELALTSSTEWGEQHEALLRDRAVAYLNVDSTGSGRRFRATTVPSLDRFVLEAADSVADPDTAMSIATAAARRAGHETGSRSGGTEDVVHTRVGTGSDYTVFLNFIGVPIIDLAFEGPYGVYHSAFDTHEWVARFGDPGFRYQTAMARLWGVMALRLANADVLPLDVRRYAREIRRYLDELSRGPSWPGIRGLGRAPGVAMPESDPLAPAVQAAECFEIAAAQMAVRAEHAVMAGGSGLTGPINEALMAVERALLDPDGLPGRPWYRHQIYAPQHTYAPQVLPGIQAALEARDAPLLSRQVDKLAAALDRATAALRKGADIGSD